MEWDRITAEQFLRACVNMEVDPDEFEDLFDRHCFIAFTAKNVRTKVDLPVRGRTLLAGARIIRVTIVSPLMVAVLLRRSSHYDPTEIIVLRVPTNEVLSYRRVE